MKQINQSMLSSDECAGIQINGLDHCSAIHCKWQGLSACQGQNIIRTGKNAKGHFVGRNGLAHEQKTFLKLQKSMKIAAPVTKEMTIDSHFGHCEQFVVYETGETGTIVQKKIIASPSGCGCKSSIALTLANEGVTLMLASGIGAGAISVLAQSGIQVVRGCEGLAEQAVIEYIEGRIKDNGESCMQHEQHHHTGHQNGGCQHHH